MGVALEEVEYEYITVDDSLSIFFHKKPSKFTNHCHFITHFVPYFVKFDAYINTHLKYLYMILTGVLGKLFL